jgi:hypothetical protein
MSLAELIKITSECFKIHMDKMCRELDIAELTEELSETIIGNLKESWRVASQVGLKAFLESYDTLESFIEVDGKLLRWKMKSDKWIVTDFGKQCISRNLYQHDDGGNGFVPLDHKWNMSGHFATPNVREAVLYSSALITPEETKQLFKKCTLFKPSTEAIKNIIEKTGMAMESHRVQLDQLMNESCQIPAGTRCMTVGLDGVNVLLREQGSTERRPKERPGISDSDPEKLSCYKNATVASICFYGDVPEDKECPQRLGAIYLSRMPEDGALTLKKQLEDLLDRIETKLPADVTKQLLMDGHISLWGYSDNTTRYDTYTKGIDYWHTLDHLSKAAEALFGKKSKKARRWYDTYRLKLKKSDHAGDAILRSMNYYKSKKPRMSAKRREEFEKQKRFFTRNRHRMTYASFRHQGLPIGSGPLEAACKSIVKTRLCRSGMRWSRTGGQHILNLRTYVKSKIWDTFWNTVRKRIGLAA